MKRIGGPIPGGYRYTFTVRVVSGALRRRERRHSIGNPTVSTITWQASTACARHLLAEKRLSLADRICLLYTSPSPRD